MLQLLYAVIFGEMFVIASFLFKTPARKLVIVSLDRIKRGRGPVVVKTIAATLLVVLASSLYSIAKIRGRNLDSPVANPTDQVLVSKHMLEASLMGFVLFLSLMIDRLHHYIRELRLLRKAMEAAKKQSRSFEDGKSVSAAEHRALLEENAMLKPKLRNWNLSVRWKQARLRRWKLRWKRLESNLRGSLWNMIASWQTIRIFGVSCRLLTIALLILLTKRACEG